MRKSEVKGLRYPKRILNRIKDLGVLSSKYEESEDEEIRNMLKSRKNKIEKDLQSFFEKIEEAKVQVEKMYAVYGELYRIIDCSPGMLLYYMKEDGLISEEEYEKLSDKAAGISEADRLFINEFKKVHNLEDD